MLIFRSLQLFQASGALRLLALNFTTTISSVRALELVDKITLILIEISSCVERHECSGVLGRAGYIFSFSQIIVNGMLLRVYVATLS